VFDWRAVPSLEAQLEKPACGWDDFSPQGGADETHRKTTLLDVRVTR
jgi:hypothetical protein